jgi:hypothetical protein
MSSWLELVLNIIGYGGFVVLASWHRAPPVDDAKREMAADKSQGAIG